MEGRTRSSMGRAQPGVAEGAKECWRPVEAGKDKEMGSPLEPPEHSPTSMSRMSCHSHLPPSFSGILIGQLALGWESQRSWCLLVLFQSFPVWGVIGLFQVNYRGVWSVLGLLQVSYILCGESCLCPCSLGTAWHFDPVCSMFSYDWVPSGPAFSRTSGGISTLLSWLSPPETEPFFFPLQSCIR